MSANLPEKTDLPLAERSIGMLNVVARAVHNLDPWEKRTVSIALAKTDSRAMKDRNVASHNGGWRVRVSAEEYATEFGLVVKNAYGQLQKVAKTLMTKQFVERRPTPRGFKEIRTNWCSQSVYHEGEGWIELSFSADAIPYLLALQGKFTTYKLKEIALLRSIYSIRLFECLASWRDTGKWVVSTEEFLRTLEVPTSLNDFAQVRRRVITPAMKELKEKNGFEIELIEHKAGRKVKTLEFKFKVSPQGDLFREPLPDLPDDGG